MRGGQGSLSICCNFESYFVHFQSETVHSDAELVVKQLRLEFSGGSQSVLKNPLLAPWMNWIDPGYKVFGGIFNLQSNN